MPPIFLTTLRLPTETHARAVAAAHTLGVSLNTYYADAIAARNQQVQDAAVGALPQALPPLGPPPESEAMRDLIQSRLGAALRSTGGRGTPATSFKAFGITMRPDAYELLNDLRRRTRLSKGVVVETGVRLLHACMEYTHPEKEQT